MKTKYFLVLTMFCGLAATVSADPMRFPYWQMIKDVVSSIETQQPRPLSISDSNQKTDFEYPFEMLRHLRATDLLRAASEGVQEARLQAALGKSEAEIEALARGNVALALEYLPMLIRSDSDLEEIALLLTKQEEDKILRLYLLQNSYPGFAPPSFLSISLPIFFDEDFSQPRNKQKKNIAFTDTSVPLPPAPELYENSLLLVVSHPSEEPVMQSTAIRLYYTKLLQQYKHTLENDPAISELIATNSSQDVVDLAKNTQITFSEDTTAALKQCKRKFHDLAFGIAGHIAEGSIRDEQVKEVTRQILQEMHDNIVNINKEVITTFLEGKPFVSTPFPQLPTSEGESGIAEPEAPQRLDELMMQHQSKQ